MQNSLHYFCILFVTVIHAEIKRHSNLHTEKRSGWESGGAGLEKQGEIESVFGSKQRPSDQDQISADQTVVLK